MSHRLLEDVHKVTLSHEVFLLGRTDRLLLALGLFSATNDLLSLERRLSELPMHRVDRWPLFARIKSFK